MIKCNRDQVKRLQKKLQREKDPVVRQRIQMILLREDGSTQPKIAELMGVSLSTVNRAHMAYDNGGVNALRPKPTGGRRNENMTLEEEKAFLARFIAPRVQRRGRRTRLSCVSVKQMRVGPSEPACRRRLQTASSCCGRKVHGGER